MQPHWSGPEERDAFFSSGQRLGHLHLTSSIIETSAGQRGPGGFNICPRDMTSYLRCATVAPLPPTTAHADEKLCAFGSPVPLVRVHYLTRQGTTKQRGPFAGGPLSHADFFPKRSRRNAGPGQECQTQKTTRHSLRVDTATMPERKRNVLHCASDCSSIMEMHFLVKRCSGRGWCHPMVELCLPRSHTLRMGSGDAGRSPRVACAHISDACVATSAESPRGNRASVSAYGVAVYPLSVCCQLSEWKLPFQSCDKKAPRPER